MNFEEKPKNVISQLFQMLYYFITFLEGPPNVPKEIVKETMAQTDALIRRVMKMTSPDDPAITSVITSEDDLQLANFLSLSLSKACHHYLREKKTQVM